MSSDSQIPDPSGSARRHAPAEQRRAQILAAALSCFAEKGYHAATMDDLARASGLSKGSLYWHFRSKLDVFLALFDALTAEIFERWEDAASEGASTTALLRADLAITIERLSAERALLLAWAEFIALPEGRARMADLYRESREKLALIVGRGVERGELRALDPPGTAAALTAFAEGLALQALVDPDFDLQAGLDVWWKIIERGVLR